MSQVRLVDLAREVAMQLAARDGQVTSSDVLTILRRRGYGPVLDQTDTRFMGAVFRGQEWERVGYLSGTDSPGSHSRPVAVWRLR